MSKKGKDMKQRAKLIIKDFISDLKINVKELFNKKTFHRQIPNLLTSIRLLAPIPFNILYFSNNLMGATIVLAIAFFTDCIDGKIARKYNIVSTFGASLDAISDKIMVIGVIIPACFSNRFLLINLLLELIIVITNSFACLMGVKVKSSNLGKFKTWPLFITIILVYLNLFTEIPSIVLVPLITITAFLQILTTLDYLSKNILNYISKKVE